jgi:ribose transport system substrate-binding protein
MARNALFKAVSLFALVALLAVALAGCAVPAAPAAEAPAAEAPAAEAPAEEAATEAPAEEAAAAEPAAAGEGPTVALVYGVRGDGFYITMENGAQDKADELGVTFFADGPAQFEPTLQVPILDAVIAQQPDAICIAATERQALIEPMRRAYDAGIHMISVDTFIGDTGGDYTGEDLSWMLSYIGSDNVEGGRIACEAIVEAMGGEGKFYIQTTQPGVSTVEQRVQGCEEAIAATNGAVELIGMDYNDDQASIAAEQTAAMLASNPDITGIFGTNLFSAQGAAQSVANAGLTGVVKVAAFDAPEDAIVSLRENVVDIVIAQHPYEIGQKCIEFAVAAVNGDMDVIEKRFPTGYTVITRDNVDSPEAQQAIYKAE